MDNSLPIFSVSIEAITDLIQKILTAYKEFMAWLGILVLPEEGDYDYPEL